LAVTKASSRKGNEVDSGVWLVAMMTDEAAVDAGHLWTDGSCWRADGPGGGESLETSSICLSASKPAAVLLWAV
jgi:hypothetical protein